MSNGNSKSSQHLMEFEKRQVDEEIEEETKSQ